MRACQFVVLALVATVTAGPLQAGSVSVSAPESTLLVGQSEVLTFSVSSGAGGVPSPSLQGVTILPTGLSSGLVPVTVQADPGLPAGSTAVIPVFGNPSHSIYVGFGSNSLSSFSGPIVEILVVGLTEGTYTVGGQPLETGYDASNSTAFYLYGNNQIYEDELAPGSSVTINVVDSLTTVPEPGGLALAGACLLVVAARRKLTGIANGRLVA